MMNLGKHTIVLLTVASLVLMPLGAALAQSQQLLDETQPQAGAMVADVVVVRPLGIASMVLGVAAFIVSIPFTTTGNNVEEAWDTLVKKPARFTFQRPLGQFD